MTMEAYLDQLEFYRDQAMDRRIEANLEERS